MPRKYVLSEQQKKYVAQFGVPFPPKRSSQ